MLKYFIFTIMLCDSNAAEMTPCRGSGRKTINVKLHHEGFGNESQ